MFSPILMRKRETTLVLSIVVAGFLITLFEPKFSSASNLVSIGTGMIYDLPVAAGMTLVLILGGIDLSVGSIIGLTAVVLAMMLQAGVAVPLALLLGLLLAMGAGAINGSLIALSRIAPFIVTLGMMSMARGVAVVLTSGYMLSGLPDRFVFLGQGIFLGLPYPVYVVAVILVVFHYLLRNWKPLHEAFYIGSNSAAAELSGINVRRLTFIGYVVSGALAGLAAIFMTSRLAMGYSRFGELAELRAIAAAVLGGASLRGGSGSILGAFFGVLLLAVIQNGFVLLKGSVYWQGVLSGVILLAAMAVDAMHARRSGIGGRWNE